MWIEILSVSLHIGRMDYLLTIGYFAICSFVAISIYIAYLLLIGKLTSGFGHFVLGMLGYLALCVGFLMPIFFLDKLLFLDVQRMDILAVVFLQAGTYGGVFLLFMRKYKMRLKELGFYREK